MATFAPPDREGNRMEGPPGHPLNPLMRFYGSWAQGTTIWKDQAGVWHESLTPYLGGAVHAVHDWDGSTYTTPDEGLATAQVVYDGGHVHTISEAAADELEAQGYTMLTRQSIADDFNGPDGPVGADLSWAESPVFAGQEFSAQQFSNQVWFFSDTPGAHEEILVPTPNIDSPNGVWQLGVSSINLTGTGNHQVGAGMIARYQPHSGNTYYRGYAVEFSRSNIISPPTDLWVLLIWRITSRTDITPLAVASLPIGSVTLPGVLTFTTNGSALSASFTHGGGGGTMNAAATDSTYTDGQIVLGFGNVQSGDEVATVVVDNFTAGPA